ncbi:MAG: hypothetical protein NWQ24_11185 [Haliea sp.]|nr:hypothetical protein [Haliea sp.]MDP5065233.1 hypothetical protein [Haliea sp.]
MPSKVKPYQYALLIMIVAAATLIRFQYNIVTWIDTPIRGDATSYVAYANNMLEHQTFSRSRDSDQPIPDAFWAPGYPTFLAGAIALANGTGQDSYILTLHLQAVLGAITVLLVFMLASMAMSVPWALFATAMMALSPHAISLGSNLLTETLFSFLLTLAILLLAKSTRKSSRLMEISAGFAFAACYLVNPVSLFIAPFAMLCLVLTNKDKPGDSLSAWLRPIFLVLAPLLATIVAWSIRSALNVPEGGQTSSGRLLGNLIIGLYSDFHEIWRADPRDPNNPATLASARIGGSYTIFFGELLALFQENPAQMLKWYFIDKPLLLWDWNIRTGQGDIFVFPVVYSLYHISNVALATYSVMHVTHGWTLLLGICAFFFAWADKTPGRQVIFIVLVTAAYCSAVYVITQAEPRYSVPLRPLLYIAAAYSLSKIALWAGQLRQAYSGPSPG